MTEQRPRLDSRDLERLAAQISNRVSLECPQCGRLQRLALERREIRFGSSPNLLEIDTRHPPKPRLLFFCVFCRRVLGHVQADEWAPPEAEASPDTRWDYLELDEK